MKVGTICSSIALDRDSRTYSGSEDPVTGNMVVEFKAWDREKGETDTQELFGPLQIHLTFEGDIKTEIDDDYLNRASHPEYRDERKLFQQTLLIYDGQIRARVGETKHFPFKVFFPVHAQPTPQQRRNGLEEQNWDLLPPAFHTDFMGTYGGGKGSVEYRIKAQIDLAGIEVDVATRGVPPSLRYRPLTSDTKLNPTTNTFEQAFIVYDDSLTPESERPHGFRAKAKAMLKDVEPPCYAFDILWMGMPTCIYPSQSMRFKVAVRTTIERTTSTTIPQIVIQECKVTIVGHCGVRVRPRFSTPKESAEMKDLEDAAVVFGTVYPDGPFSKASDYVKTITTQTLPYLPCSFAVEKLSRYYKAWIHMTLQVGGERVNARRLLSLTVMPPMQSSIPQDLDSMQAGASQRFKEDEEQLPAYE
jgi:hypothetical protein